MRIGAAAGLVGLCVLATPACARPDAAAQSGRTVVLPRDTPVVLLAPSEVRSDKVAAGTLFKLRVQQAIRVGGDVVVPVGTPAFGEVVAAASSGGLGKNGTMDVKLRYIQFGDVRIPIEGGQTAKGTGAGSAGIAVVFVGVAGLFHRGNNATIKAGELLTGFVAQDVALDFVATPVRRAADAVAIP